MDTHGLGRELEGGLAGEQLGHPGLDVAAQPGHLALGRVAGEEAGRLQPGGHVGQLELDGLVLGDGLAEGGPLLGVGQRGVEGGAGHAHRPRGDVDASDLEHPEDLGQAPARLADEVGRRHPVVRVRHLDGLDPLVAELAHVLAHGDPLEGRPGVLLHDEGGDPLFGAGGQGHQAGPFPVGDPCLGAVHHVHVPVPFGAAGDVAGVAAGIGLGQ